MNYKCKPKFTRSLHSGTGLHVRACAWYGALFTTDQGRIHRVSRALACAITDAGAAPGDHCDNCDLVSLSISVTRPGAVTEVKEHDFI